MADACSIDGCGNDALARGWCRKHYARWKSHGDPEKLVGDREPNAPVESKRVIGNSLVYITTLGDPFVLVERKRKGEVVRTRCYGQIITCENCTKEAFIKNSGAKRERRFCSHKCAGPVVAKQRRTGKRYKSVDAADALFSKIVRARSGACVNCGSVERLQCAHGFSRRYRNARWDYRNAFCLCAGCHMFFTHRPIEWDNWLRERWGGDLYDEIRALAQQTTKVSVPDVIERLYADKKVMDAAGVTAVPGHPGWTGLEGDG